MTPARPPAVPTLHRAARSVACLALFAATAFGPAWAQAPAAPVLKPSQVTESALMDALEVPVEQDASGQTRAIRPSMSAGGTQKPAGPGKASLLITFATGSAELTPETVTTLETVAKALQSDRLAGFQFRVEGHADPRGGAELNQRLSEARAQAVVAHLTGKLGVLPDRLTPVGKGASELLNTQRPDAQENRRVTIVTVR